MAWILKYKIFEWLLCPIIALIVLMLHWPFVATFAGLGSPATPPPLQPPPPLTPILPPLPPQPLSYLGHLLQAQPYCCQKLFLVEYLVPLLLNPAPSVAISFISQAMPGAPGSAHCSFGLSPGSENFSVPLISCMHLWHGSKLQAQRLAWSSRRSPWLLAIGFRFSVLPGAPGSVLRSLCTPLPWLLAVENDLLMDCCVVLDSLSFGFGFRLSPLPSAPSGWR